MTTAAEQCAQNISGSRVMNVDGDGRIYFEADRADMAPFQECVRRTLSRSPEVTRFTNGRLTQNAGKAAVPIQKRDGLMFVPAMVNGVKAILLLDTGATFTVIRPRLAQQAGLPTTSGAPRFDIKVVGGRTISVPVVRARQLGIGNAAVENIAVGIYDAVPAIQHVDGILGGNFLSHFTMTIDGKRNRLILVPAPQAKPL